jgi:hypothetical protein
MSIIIKGGSSGHLAEVDVNGNLNVVVSGAITTGDNTIGRMKITDGVNVLGTLANPLVTSAAPPQDLIVTGTIASSPTANVAINSQGSGAVLIYISGSWSGTLEFEASPDGAFWRPARCFPKPSNAVSVFNTSTNGVWIFSTAGANMFRVRASAWSTGVATVHLEATQSTQVVEVCQLYAQNLNTYATCVGTLADNSSAGSLDAVNLSVLPAHSTAFAVVHTEGTMSFLHTDLLGNLRTRNRAESVLGDLVCIPRLNQIEINFSEGFDANEVTNAATGGGSFTVATGAAEYHTGAAATGAASGTTIQQLQYHPGHEWYCKFTAAFTTPTDAFNPNHQRIGPFNATDGFYIGFEKTTFCLTQFQGGVPTHFPKASWNGDPVDGSTNSTFTRHGVPEVLNFNFINVYRLRGSWFGTAPVQLQVLTPDMDWATLHTFAFPNSEQLPYAYTTNWNIAVEVSKTGSDTTDLKIRVPCLVLGTNNDTAAINDPLTDYAQAKVVRAILTGKNLIGGTYDNVGLSTENAVTVAGSGLATLDAAVWDSTTPQDTFVMPLHFDYHHNTVTIALVSTSPIDTGAITFEGSIDNVHFVGLIGVDVGSGLAMTSATVAIAAGSTKIYTFNVTGFDHFRYRLSTAITNTGTVTSSYLVQGLSSPNVSTTITTGTINVDSNQGTPNSLNNAWPMEITDGTHGPAAIKEASTAAIASDLALVVAVSPNNSVAVTGTFWPVTQPVSGAVQLLDSGGTNKASIDASGNLAVSVPTLGAKTDAKDAHTDSASITIMQVLKEISFMEQNPASAAVTNAGTFAVQETVLDAALIAQETSTSGVKGLTIFGAVTTNAPSYTNGKSDALSLDPSGLLRISLKDTPANTNKFLVTADAITFASPQAVTESTLDGCVSSSKLAIRSGNGDAIVEIGDGTHTATFMSTTTSSKYGLDTNILSILGTAPTTAGKLDIKGADGDVIARTRPAAPATGVWSHLIIAVAAATGVQSLIPLSGSTTIRVMKVQFTTDKATDFNFLDSTPTALSGVYKLTGNGSSFSDSGDGEPLWVGASGKAFQINLTGTVTLGGDIWYTQS